MSCQMNIRFALPHFIRHLSKYTSLYKWNKIQNLSYCWVFQVALLLWQKWVTPESTWLDLFEFSLDPQTSWKQKKICHCYYHSRLNLVIAIFDSFPVWNKNPSKFQKLYKSAFYLINIHTKVLEIILLFSPKAWGIPFLFLNIENTCTNFFRYRMLTLKIWRHYIIDPYHNKDGSHMIIYLNVLLKGLKLWN